MAKVDRYIIVDLTPWNIAFELPNIQSMDINAMFKLFGPITSEILTLPNGSHSPHAPKSVFKATRFPGLDRSTLVHIRIIDFGQAFFADRPPCSLGAPIEYFPPEICFGLPPSPKSDIWQLACLIYMVHGKAPMLPTVFRVFEILIGTAVQFLGPLPQEWKGRFIFDKYGYQEMGKEPQTVEPAWWYGEEQQFHRPIEERLGKVAGHLEAGQLRDLMQLLREMAVFEPERRLDVVGVVRRLGSGPALEE